MVAYILKDEDLIASVQKLHLMCHQDSGFAGEVLSETSEKTRSSVVHCFAWARSSEFSQMWFEEEMPRALLVEQVLGDLGVDGAERVVEQVDVGVAVEGARQVDARLLPAAQIHTALTRLRQVAARHQVHVLQTKSDTGGQCQWTRRVLGFFLYKLQPRTRSSALALMTLL